MLELITKDKEIVESSYTLFLRNLCNFLRSNGKNSGLSCAKEVIKMLHNGSFSMTGDNICTNDYDFLYLPNLESDGMLVMYGICCCRHAAPFLYDVLTTLNIDCSLVYILTSEDGNWRIVRANAANHVVVMLKENGKKYMLDAVNKFIVEVMGNGDLEQLEIDEDLLSTDYNDSNIGEIGKVLTKYYDLKNLGIDHIYDY